MPFWWNRCGPLDDVKVGGMGSVSVLVLHVTVGGNTIIFKPVAKLIDIYHENFCFSFSS
jgi:hypothetical protein